MFNNNLSIGKKTGIAKESKILIGIWKDSISYQQAYRKLSQKIAGDLKVESALNTVRVDDIIQDDLFELIDKRIISELAQLICEEAISNERLSQLIKQRENKYWYPDYEDFYACLENGMMMITSVRKADKLKINDKLLEKDNEITSVQKHREQKALLEKENEKREALANIIDVYKTKPFD